VPTLAETSSAAKFLSTVLARADVSVVWMCIIDRIAPIFGYWVKMPETTRSLVIPSIAASDVPAAIRAPLHFILGGYEIRVAENMLTDFGRKIYEG
jgi:hypothetical protein